MTLKIEAGKFYRTRDGRKVGPIERMRGLDPYVWRGRIDGAFRSSSLWQESGLNSPKFSPESDLDLVAEWPAATACVREVTRLEIVPGTYGIVEVNVAERDDFVAQSQPVHVPSGIYSASELRAAARVFNALAEALEHGK